MDFAPTYLAAILERTLKEYIFILLIHVYICVCVKKYYLDLSTVEVFKSSEEEDVLIRCF